MNEHPLLVAAQSGDRKALLQASLEYAIESLADPKCPAYVRAPLLGRVQSLSQEIEAMEDAARLAAAETTATPDEPWDPDLI